MSGKLYSIPIFIITMVTACAFFMASVALHVTSKCVNMAVFGIIQIVAKDYKIKMRLPQCTYCEIMTDWKKKTNKKNIVIFYIQDLLRNIIDILKMEYMIMG